MGKSQEIKKTLNNQIRKAKKILKHIDDSYDLEDVREKFKIWSDLTETILEKSISKTISKEFTSALNPPVFDLNSPIDTE